MPNEKGPDSVGTLPWLMMLVRLLRTSIQNGFGGPHDLDATQRIGIAHDACRIESSENAFQLFFGKPQFLVGIGVPAEIGDGVCDFPASDGPGSLSSGTLMPLSVVRPSTAFNCM